MAIYVCREDGDFGFAEDDSSFFPNGKSAIWGIYREDFLGGFLEQIQDL